MNSYNKMIMLHRAWQIIKKHGETYYDKNQQAAMLNHLRGEILSCVDEVDKMVAKGELKEWEVPDIPAVEK